MSSVFEFPYLTTPVYLPEDEEQRVIRTTELFNDSNAAVNMREIAFYDPSETPTGQQWLNSIYQNDQPLIPFRRVYNVTLTAPGVTTFAHGITGLIFCTRIEGTAAAPDRSQFVPLPQATPDDVAITVSQTNITITAATGTYSGYVAVIILEYFRS